MSRERVDVAVVGGGPAGVAAAVAAAQSGARTCLLERERRLGGNAGEAFVHTLCGLYRSGTDELAHGGLIPAFIERLKDAGAAAAAPEVAERVSFLPISPGAFAAVLSEWAGEAGGLGVSCECPLVGMERGSEGFALALGDGRRLEASLVIDASGDAAAAALSADGTASEPAASLQRPSYIVALRGLAAGAAEGFARVQLSAALARAARARSLAARAESVVIRPGVAPGEAHLTLNLATPSDWDPLDPAVRDRLEADARGAVEAIVPFLRATRPGYEGVEVAAWPHRIGIRESRRVRTRVEVDAEHVLGGRRTDDEVALSTWPIELWRDHRRAEIRHAVGPCSIPLGALESAVDDRLGAAGRCMGGSQEALAAFRVIGTALATGQAIGVAAALAADEGVTLPEVTPAKVRSAVASLPLNRSRA